MSKKTGFFSGIFERFFGKSIDTKDSVSIQKQHPKTSNSYPRTPPVIKKPQERKRNSHFIQIGFDFGTSYSKCICRDVNIDKAWVHIPPALANQELPFLIPSTILFQDGKFKHINNSSIEYHQNGLNHIKLALEKVALKKWDDLVLKPYFMAVGNSDPNLATSFVCACGVYLLAGSFSEVRRDIRNRFKDFGSHLDDYMAINLAIPVADAAHPEVNALYQNVLYNAWGLADQIGGYPNISASELEGLISQYKIDQTPDLKEACFLYPEVSANVQGFVRSRVSMPGTYLFSDTGAGSVDQSVFIFCRKDNAEHLTYLHGSVLPLGSSRIENIAASASGNLDWENLEIWRKKKESGDTDPELESARNEIEKELSRGTQTTLAWAKKKLFVKEQLYESRLIFGGGGHCNHPYTTGVKKPFSGSLFPRDITPSTVGMPVPRDLELKQQGDRWMRRLSVAYGLSFVKPELAKFIYPGDLSDPKPDEIWSPTRDPIDAPTKDVC